jgi:drug/metabolite transporter (DMT)-like permease
MMQHNSVAIDAPMDAGIMLPERSAIRLAVSSVNISHPKLNSYWRLAPGLGISLYNRIVFTDAIGEGSESKTTHKPLRLKTFLMILVMIVTGPLGSVLLGQGMKHVGAVVTWPPSQLLHTALRIFATTSIWVGISFQLLFFVSYMLVLSWADYSFVQPASSLAYGMVALLSYLILGETVSPLRWLGIAIICLGVFVTSHTAPRTTSQKIARQI